MSDDKYEKWDPISIEDMEAYFGFNILMGINSLPSHEDYWKKDPVFHMLLLLTALVETDILR